MGRNTCPQFAMNAPVTVVAGPAGCGKTKQLLQRYRMVLAQNRPAAAVWICPTWRAAAELRDRLLDEKCTGCFSPGITTFEQFAKALVEAAPDVIRPISQPMKRQLVRHLIDDQSTAGRLKHFRSIARTSGLVDLVCGWISELKRLEIWPDDFRRACQARGIAEKDLELAEIYEQYQQCLVQHGLYDAEGRFWSARRLLKDGHRGPFARLKLVVADGFTDFTRTQHEILEILAEWVDDIQISLPWEETTERKDLFAKSAKTLAELRRRHQEPIVEVLPRNESSTWPAMQHLEKRLFANPRRRQPAPETEGIEILAAARQAGEIELIGSRIKRLLAQHDARPGEIAVVLRSPEQSAPLIAQVFDRLGIPVAMESGQTLDRGRALAALVNLLQLDADDWPFRQLLGLLGSNYFGPDWDEPTRATAEKAVRRLQIPRGRERLLRSFGHREDEQDVLAALGRLADAFDAMPREATPADWAKAWRRLARDTGLLAMLQQDLPEGTYAAISDRAAWDRMFEALMSADRLARWLDRDPPRWDRREALAALVDILASQRLGQGGDESGRVRVLSAGSVRALRIPYLFVAGLSEKAFPPPEREDRLYSEAEYARLIEQGLPLVARRERNREEMLLFYEVITRATRRLYLSYPALDESAQPLSPSPFLTEVEETCGRETIRRMPPADLSPIPADDEPLSATEFRIKAMATALDGNVALLAGLLRWPSQPSVGQNLLSGLHITGLRSHAQEFGPAEGMLDGEAARRCVTERQVDGRTFSATELERYASCPYRFFLERVLKIEPPEELALAVDYLQRGRRAHDVLAAYHHQINEQLGRPGSPGELDPEASRSLIEQAVDEVLGTEPHDGVQAALHEIDRRLLLAWMEGYGPQHEKYDALWKKCDDPLRPAWFEVSFGRPLDGEGPPSTELPLELTTERRTIRLAGRVDRIDLGQADGQPVFNVIDYKTGKAPRPTDDSVIAGTTLQLPLYAMATERLLLADRKATPWQAGYWELKQRGFRDRDAMKMDSKTDWQTLQRTVVETVGRLVRQISEGQFPVCCADDNCTGLCPYKTVCRINQIRSLNKTADP